MQFTPRRAFAVALPTALLLTVAGIGIGVGGTASAVPTATPGWSHKATKVSPTSDTYVSRESRHATAGSSHLLVVRNTHGSLKMAYLKFTIPKSLLSNHGKIESVVLKLRAAGKSRSRVAVRAAKKNTWTEAKLNYAHAPRGSATIARLAEHAGGVRSASLSSYVRTAGTYSFQLTTSKGVSRFYSSESHGKSPALIVTVKRPTAAPASHKAMLGMSAPNPLWAQRVSEVGSGLEARRLFFLDFAAGMGKAQEACDAGMYPVMSFKTGAYSWAQVAAGTADADLRALATRINALTCDVFVAIHHEPEGDGTAADWSAMQVHALPILGGAIGGKVKVGVIGNGWWWSGEAKGYTDAQIAAWVTPGVLQVSDVIAGDTYQGSATGEEVATKITRMGAWARRIGGVRALGLGEFNTQTAQGITNATTALGQDSLFAWGCLWNADGTGSANATVLTGDRLTAFRSALASW